MRLMSEARCVWCGLWNGRVVIDRFPLTPWPCHIPTDQELENAQSEKAAETAVEEDAAVNSNEFQMVYSRVHGCGLRAGLEAKISNSGSQAKRRKGLLCANPQRDSRSDDRHPSRTERIESEGAADQSGRSFPQVEKGETVEL